MRRVVLRCDASVVLGSGHVMRCLTLAGALRARGVDAQFICREHPGHLCDRIEARGFRVHRLPAAGKSEAEDLRAVLEGLAQPPDWLVFDHYSIDQRTESALRDCTGGIFVIDDLADRDHDCDVLLDQNLFPRMQERYLGKVSPACAQLLGPYYALLQPEYEKLHDDTPARAGAIRRVFVFISGADVDNLTGMALRAALRVLRDDMFMDVVMTASHPFADEIRVLAREHSGIQVHTDLPTLAPLMAQADLAIGASGATSWERACVGLPSLVVSLAENQRPVAAGLAERGIARWLGHKDEVTEEIIARELSGLIATGLEADWSHRCSLAVDGRGAGRVCDALLLDSDSALIARPAHAGDEDLLLEWVNDPVTRANSFSTDPIAGDTHRAWFRARLAMTDRCRIFVVETPAGTSVGQVRFDRRGEVWEIDYSLSPRFRGRGLGRPLLDAALRAFGADERGARVAGRVKETNVPSRRVFEAMGFEQSSDQQGIVYQRSL